MHWRNGGKTVGGLDQSSRLHNGANTRAGSELFAGATPPCVQPDLAVVVQNRPFIQRKGQPVEPFDPGFDHREFAVYIFLSAFGISIGSLLAIAVALLDWS